MHITVDSAYPRTISPRILPLACSTKMGGLVKLSHIQWHIWTCWGVAHSRENSK